MEKNTNLNVETFYKNTAIFTYTKDFFKYQLNQIVHDIYFSVGFDFVCKKIN